MRTLAVLGSLPLAIVWGASVYGQEVRTGGAAFGTWEVDAPGLGRHIRPTDLPAPSLTQNDPEAPDFENMAKVVAAPEGKMPAVPQGFRVQTFATGLNQPRVLRIAPNGDLFVAESGSGRVLVFPVDAAGDGLAKPEVFTEGLQKPFGIVFYPPSEPRYVYVAAANQVVVSRTVSETAGRRGRPPYTSGTGREIWRPRGMANASSSRSARLPMSPLPCRTSRQRRSSP